MVYCMYAYKYTTSTARSRSGARLRALRGAESPNTTVRGRHCCNRETRHVSHHTFLGRRRRAKKGASSFRKTDRRKARRACLTGRQATPRRPCDGPKKKNNVGDGSDAPPPPAHAKSRRSACGMPEWYKHK